MKYCKKCGLPETYPGIEFDDSGYCNYCHFYEEHEAIFNDKDRRHEIFCKKVEEAKKRRQKQMRHMTA